MFFFFLIEKCRQRHTTYSGRLVTTIEYSHNGKVIDRIERPVGQVPIMIKVKGFKF
jgi:DNA-directed RNA polymerase beta subunit